jgi:hypothetical protein
MLWLLALVVLVLALPVALGLTIAAVVAVIYYFSLHFHPDRDCRTCNGTGRHRGYVFLWTRRQCRDCAGAGRHRRLGNVILHPNRDVLFERSANKSKGRRNAPRA